MVDYIIVGAGLSGLCLAEELLNREKSIMVFENDSQHSSSVAGGIFNPVILKRFTMAWNAGSQLNEALPFYQNLEKKLNVNLVHELPVYRKFSSVEEQNNWFEAMDKPTLAPFLDPGLVNSLNINIPSPFSFGRVNRTGRIDTTLLISRFREYLKKLDALSANTFEHSELIINEDKVNYKGIEARHIIFCEGFGMLQNPFFNFLPLYGNKGEYIIVKAPGLNLSVAVKSSVFILPMGDDLYKVGATYDNKDTKPIPTEEAREYLIEKLSKIITCKFEVTGQVAGIRPATRDRKPVLGRHPTHSPLYICNGFGSRGILMAPAMANVLIESIEHKKPLDREIDIKRFL